MTLIEEITQVIFTTEYYILKFLFLITFPFRNHDGYPQILF